MDSNIKNSFCGKNVLITGATGFVGKVLLEKLLRDCTELEKIYILIRPKRNLGLNARIQKLFDNHLYNRLKTENPNYLEKVYLVNGDLLVSPNFGISDEDLEILRKKIDFVVHSAASVRFTDKLKDAVALNTIATRNMIKLAETFENLNSFVYVSTAYSNTNRKIIEEKVYEPIMDYRKVIEVCEGNDSAEQMRLERKALKVFPNTYVFSKNLAEKLVSESDLPIAILRPSIVACAAREPVPGWLEFKRSGPIGTTFVAGLGIHRTLYADGNLTFESIPVDYCANAIIAATSYIAQRPREPVQVFNLICSAQSSFTIQDSWDICADACKAYPSKNAAWMPRMILTKFYPYFLIRFLLFQLLPALFIDMILLLGGRKAQLVKVQRKIYSGTMGFSYFLLNKWIWSNDNLMRLFDQMSLTDRNIFNFDMRSRYFYRMFYDGAQIFRYVIEKHTKKDMVYARKKYVFLYFLELLVRIAFWSVFGYFIFTRLIPFLI